MIHALRETLAAVQAELADLDRFLGKQKGKDLPPLPEAEALVQLHKILGQARKLSQALQVAAAGASPPATPAQPSLFDQAAGDQDKPDGK